MNAFRYVSTFFKSKCSDFLTIMGFSEIKIDKNELFCTIFDLKSSVSGLISLEMIKYVDYYVLIN